MTQRPAHPSLDRPHWATVMAFEVNVQYLQWLCSHVGQAASDVGITKEPSGSLQTVERLGHAL